MNRSNPLSRAATALAALGMALAAGCSALPNGAHSTSAPPLTFSVPPATTFDLSTARALDDEALLDALTGVSLLFLGEQHTDRRSHEFQERVMRGLLHRGRRITVGLEMLPPSADKALAAWTAGGLDEEEFLERSGWYRVWGYPWAYYRSIFTLIRDRGIPVHGLTAEQATRRAVREDRTASLAPALRQEIGELNSVDPFDQYLLHALRQGGHGSEMDPGSAEFQRFRRVQSLWDRLIGVRASRLARPSDPRAIVIVLVGSGHLAYKLGVNFQAARTLRLSQRSVWDNTASEPPHTGSVAAGGGGHYPVPVGMADFARVYPPDPNPIRIPTLGGMKLKPTVQGLLVNLSRPHLNSGLSLLRSGDVITIVDGRPVGRASALRLAYEALAPGAGLTLDVLRQGKPVTLTLKPRHAP